MFLYIINLEDHEEVAKYINKLRDTFMISKIVSGGQTGADRAGLDIAIKLGIPYAGWCPKGKLDELGTIPGKYDQLNFYQMRGTMTSYFLNNFLPNINI